MTDLHSRDAPSWRRIFTSFQAIASPLPFYIALCHLSQLKMGKAGARPAKAAKTASSAQDSDAEKPKRKALDWWCDCKFNAVSDAYLKQTKKWTDGQFGGQVAPEQSATAAKRYKELLVAITSDPEVDTAIKKNYEPLTAAEHMMEKHKNSQYRESRQAGNLRKQIIENLHILEDLRKYLAGA